jgi:hypothetical protein
VSLAGVAALALIGLGQLPATASGGESLVFLVQPADAVVNTTITGQPFQTAIPPAMPVEVEVLKAGSLDTTSNAMITLSINSASPPPGGNLTSPPQRAVNGIASFTTLSINLHGHYTLLASSNGGISSGTSNAFTIWDNATPCAQNKSCSVTDGDPAKQTTQITGTSSSDATVALSLGADTVNCNDGLSHAPFVTSDEALAFNGSFKTAVVTISKAEVLATKTQVNNGAGNYGVCFGTLDPNGNVTGAHDLPNCTNPVPVTFPCVESISKTQSGQVVETILLTPGDGGVWW